MGVCQRTHSFCEDLVWQNCQWQLIWWPLIVQGFLVWLCTVPVFVAVGGDGPLSLNLKFQAVSRHLTKCGVSTGLHVLDFLASIFWVGLWVRRLHTHSIEDWERVVEVHLCVIFVAHYALSRVLTGFEHISVWSPVALANVFTVVPVLVAPTVGSACSINWGYFRGFLAVVAFEHIDGLDGFFEEIGLFARAAIRSTLRVSAALLFLGGTVLMFEVFGDPGFISEGDVAGPLSFDRMVYFVIMTTTTVGNGDFVPTTSLARLVTVIGTFVGLCFVVFWASSLDEIKATWSKCRGVYHKPHFGVKHVAFLSGGIEHPGSLIRTFHDELYSRRYACWCARDPGCPRSWPACAYMADHGQPEAFLDMRKHSSRHARHLTGYFPGSVLRHGESEKVALADASLTFIVANLDAENLEDEDHRATMQALVVARLYPLAPFHLCLALPESRVTALRLGIDATRTCSLLELKYGIMAQNCLVRGWLTMLTTLLVSTAVDGEDVELTHRCIERDQRFDDCQWFREFRYSAIMGFVRFRLHSHFEGTTFREFCLSAAERSVVPLAVVSRGSVLVAPLDLTIRRGDVVLAVAPQDMNYQSFEEPASSFMADEDVSAEHFHSVSKNTKRPSEGVWRPDAVKGLQLKCGLIATNQSVARSTTLARALESGRMLAAEGGHMVVAVLDSHAWQHAYLFVRSLLIRQESTTPPVVVLAPSGGPSEVCAGTFFGSGLVTHRGRFDDEGGIDNRIGLVWGNAADRCDLLRSGVHRCVGVSILAAYRSHKDARRSDTAGVFALASVEDLFLAIGTQGVPVQLEVHHEDSVRLCSRLPRCLQRFMLPEHYSSLYSAREDASEPHYCHPRFATGGVVTSSFFGGLLAQSYYIPQIVDLVEALVLGGDATTGGSRAGALVSGDDGINAKVDEDRFEGDGKAMVKQPWQVSVPHEFVGRPYVELVRCFLCKPWHGVCLGLYRQRFDDIAASGCYAVVNPPRHTLLRRTDLVTVIAGLDFGRLCATKGLLVNTAAVAKSCPARTRENVDAVAGVVTARAG